MLLVTTLRTFSLIIFSSTIVAFVDAAGTWVCQPCQSSSCEIANPYAVIRYSGGSTYSGGSVRCNEIQDNENGVTKPTVCGIIQQQTFSNDNPCGCNSGGGQCEAAFESNDSCDICQGLSVGDPNRTLPGDATYPGITCQLLEEMSAYTFDSNSCPKAQADANLYCQCSDSAVVPCVPHDLDKSESKCSASTVCCDGVCQYRGSSLGLICSTRYALSKDKWPDWALEKVPYPQNRVKVEATTSSDSTTSMAGLNAKGIVVLLLSSVVTLFL